MKTDHRILKRAIAASIACVGMASLTAQAYGPLYIFDYETGTPYRWDVSEPVRVYTDGGNFASGTVRLRNSDLPTCNAEGGWVCYEDVYVEFTNEQGVARVAESLASWSAVPTSTFQAEVAGTFAELGIGGDDGDITGAEEEFSQDANGNWAHEILGTVNGGGIHVVFDEDGDVMRNVLGVPYGVLGVASPEWADEETGTITEGWVFIGGAQTYYNDENLAQMAGVITHELGHSFNLAHTQTNGHLFMYGNWAVVTAGPTECSAHWYLGGEYDLPFPQSVQPTANAMAVMYPYISNNPNAWPSPTGQYQATASTPEDFAAISSIYPAPSFASETGTITGTVTYPFGRDGIIGVNIVARNLDDPFEDAITVMSGDWNDGVKTALQGEGDYTLRGLTPGARYVVHVENIFAGGFPTPQVKLPGPSEYWNGNRESDDARLDDACDFEPITVAAGETRANVDIEVNGTKRAPRLMINPAPNATDVTDNGKVMAGTVSNNYGQALSWVHHEGTDDYLLVPMGRLTMSANGSMMAGRVFQDDQYLPARMVPGGDIELLPPAGNNACDQGGGISEPYSHQAMSPDGSRIGGFLWNCDKVEGRRNFVAAAATWSEAEGWTVLDDHFDQTSSRVNALANDGTAVGWAVPSMNTGWWEGRIWKNGETINLMEAAPEGTQYVGEATGVTTDGRFVVGTDHWDMDFNQRGFRYDVQTGEFTVLDISEPCPWWDWFCFGSKPFNPFDISDEGTMVGSLGLGSGAVATIANDVLGAQKLTDFLRGQGVINANDLGIASSAIDVSSDGRHIVGWTAVDGYFGSWKLSLDQLWVCRDGKSQQVGYPGAVKTQLANGAVLGLCEADLPKQYKDNY